jgi:hypothetical protein
VRGRRREDLGGEEEEIWTDEKGEERQGREGEWRRKEKEGRGEMEARVPGTSRWLKTPKDLVIPNLLSKSFEIDKPYSKRVGSIFSGWRLNGPACHEISPTSVNSLFLLCDSCSSSSPS